MYNINGMVAYPPGGGRYMTPKENNLPTNTAEFLTEEIRLILARNQDERFLRKLLTRALILEELMR